MTERVLSHVQAAEMRFFRRVHRVDTPRQSAQLWNSQSSEFRATSPNREIPVKLVRSCVQKILGKIGEESPAGYTPVKAAQRSCKDKLAWLYLRSCLVSYRCGASRTIWNCWKPRGILSSLELLPPRPSWEEKKV